MTSRNSNQWSNYWKHRYFVPSTPPRGDVAIVLTPVQLLLYLRKTMAAVNKAISTASNDGNDEKINKSAVSEPKAVLQKTLLHQRPSCHNMARLHH